MNTTQDLRYWANKTVYAETLYGDKKQNMKKVCDVMINLYLDQYLDQKKMGLDVLETIPG